MKDRKFCFPHFAFYDRVGKEDFLNEQARQGWKFEGFGSSRYSFSRFFGCWRFRRANTEKLHYAVSYSRKYAHPDEDIPMQQAKYQAFCYDAGWQFVDTVGATQIYMHQGGDPIPMETDALMELDQIHKTVKQRMRKIYGIHGLLIVFWCVILTLALYIPSISALSQTSYLLWPTAHMVSLLIMICETASYLLWRRKALREAARSGNLIPAKYPWTATVFSYILPCILCTSVVGDASWLLVAVAICGIFAMLLLPTMVVINQMERKLVLPAVRKIVTYSLCVICLVVPILLTVYTPLSSHFLYAISYGHRSIHAAPLTLEDLYGEEYEDAHHLFSGSESMIAGQYRVRTDGGGEGPILDYDITIAEIPLLFGRYLDTLLDETSPPYLYRQVDAAPWGASEVYHVFREDIGRHCYLLCYEDVIVDLWMSIQPTAEQIAIIGEKFTALHK